ncbi:MAG: hypothetical protein IKC94_04255, partial [Lentisphaeria bacterium]|nr:hypothetical protein [Lentisphaeria bacterium]
QRVFQSFTVKPSTTYKLEYYVKCENIVPQPDARFAGAASWISMKKNTPLRGKQGPWKLDTAPGGWQLVSYTFKTGPEDTTAAVEFQLRNASGTVWFDGVKITEISGEAETRLSAKLYPVEFLKEEPFQLAENLTGTLILRTGASVNNLTSNGTMTLDVPDFVQVIGSAPILAINPAPQGDSRRRITPYQIEELENIIRDGKKYRRFRITFDRNFTRLISAQWYQHAIFLKAEKGNVGKSAPFYFRLNVGNETSPEGCGRLKIVPQIIHQTPPCRHFAFMLARIPSLQTAGLAGQQENHTFWSALSEQRYSWLRACDTPLPGFRPVMIVGGPFWSVITSIQPKIAELARLLPQNITDKGKVGAGFANWSKLDDQTGKVEEIYRLAAREIRRLYPEVEDVVWDFEPHPYGYDERGRKRFAQTIKLDHVPEIAEIQEKYRTEYFRYMVDLHAQYANRAMRIFKEEAKGIRFWFCSDNLSASGSHVSAWCGVDIRLSDHVADGHMPMPYYSGPRFFDDVAFNIDQLEKPFFPLIDPAENIASFYHQYNPAKVRQNILAAAALGAKGIGFWPNDALSADYFRAISEAYSMVSAAEEFYFAGKRCDEEFTFEPANAMIKEVENEQGQKVKLYFPDFPRFLRTTVHQLGTDYLFTCFNYHDSQAVLLRIKGHGEMRLIEIPPQGVTQYRLSQQQDPELLKKLELFNTVTSDRKIPELKNGDASLEWAADSRGMPYFRLKSRSSSIGIDLLGDSRITSFLSPTGNELLDGGFMAHLIFSDPLQPKTVSVIHSMRIINNSPEVVLKGVVGPYAGANPAPNPLTGMEIFRKFLLNGDILEIEFLLHNPTDRTMNPEFRINNYPFPGKRFGAQGCRNTLRSNDREVIASAGSSIFARKGATVPFFGRRKPELWDGGPLIMSAEAGRMKDRLEFIPDQSFNGIMYWFGTDSNTVELLPGMVNIPPGGSAVFRYRVKISGQSAFPVYFLGVLQNLNRKFCNTPRIFLTPACHNAV